VVAHEEHDPVAGLQAGLAHPLGHPGAARSPHRMAGVRLRAVEDLAGRSAGAGKAIESQITDSVGRVARGSTRVDWVGRAITLMDGAALQNSAPVEQSAHAA
jgi:hypothetical protein